MSCLRFAWWMLIEVGKRKGELLETSMADLLYPVLLDLERGMLLFHRTQLPQGVVF